MKRYLDEKICKKVNLLLSQKDELVDIEILIDNCNKYFADFNALKQMNERFPQTEKEVLKDVEQFDTKPSLNEKINELNQPNQAEKAKEDLFNKNYRLIQSHILEVRQLESNFLNHQQ